MLIALVTLLAASGPISIRVGDARATGVDGAVAQEWLERVATQLQRNGAVRVVQSQSDGILQGSVSKVELTWKVALEIRRARDGSVWAAIASDFVTEDAAAEWLEQAALDLEVDLRPTGVLLQRAVAPPATPAWLRLLPGAAGLALGAGAAATLIMSAEQSVQLRANPNAELQKQQHTLEVTGAILAGAAAVGLASSVVWFGASNNVITVAPTGGGASVSLSGRF